jgi:deoxyribonuclease (pyrimidine dimer)
MTRINIVPVESLSRQHLVAEYREITRLPGNLYDSLNRKTKPFSMAEIPPKYVLGTGHVKFFYDKMLFLENRFKQIVDEMLNRGYNPNFTDTSIFRKCSEQFYNDYKPTQEAIDLNLQRIKERTKEKPNA